MKAIDLIREFAKARKADGNRHSCGNVYYIGNVLYSYGAHFPLAVIDGKTAYYNADKYSPTTSKQQTWIKDALEDAGYKLRSVSTATIKRMVACGVEAVLSGSVTGLDRMVEDTIARTRCPINACKDLPCMHADSSESWKLDR